MSLISLFIMLVVLFVVFALAYWMVTLVGAVLPPPVKQPAVVVMTILLCLIAICCLLDLVGLFGPRHMLIHL